MFLDYTYLIEDKNRFDGRPFLKGTSIEPENLSGTFNLHHDLREYPSLRTEQILECYHFLVNYR